MEPLAPTQSTAVRARTPEGSRCRRAVKHRCSFTRDAGSGQASRQQWRAYRRSWRSRAPVVRRSQRAGWR